MFHVSIFTNLLVLILRSMFKLYYLLEHKTLIYYSYIIDKQIANPHFRFNLLCVGIKEYPNDDGVRACVRVCSSHLIRKYIHLKTHVTQKW